MKNILYLLCITIFVSCGKDYTTVEIYQQNRDMLKKVETRISTTNGNIDLTGTKDKIYPYGKITGISVIHYQYDYYENCEVNYKILYSETKKRIVFYFFRTPIGPNKEIDSLEEIFYIEPYNDFEGFYTTRFIYKNDIYQAVSLYNEIKLENLADDFDYTEIRKTGMTQYKKVGEFIELEDKRFRIIQVNYIFPEEIDTEYTKYSFM
ncbi:hypothetical protein [Breznakiella homolactica]|uniref:Lipoprotein n=1 Tax=Breznakiella homolactica TaxID=2798577 RepID=A0A7T8BC92_9SPIR|nr:hypothetical protein [Breznakiella homolactica]QQO09993.1 hypothetical protein JFL75_03505 [Breznakiella homolactica]